MNAKKVRFLLFVAVLGISSYSLTVYDFMFRAGLQVGLLTLLPVEVEPVTEPPPFQWAMCALIRDENVALPEWLAYHVTTLPLGRIILGQDPTAKTDPTPILERFEETVGLNWTLLDYDDYYFPGRWSHTRKNYTHFTHENGTVVNVSNEKQHWHYIWRQQALLTTCLRQLKEEGYTWTAIIDPDEYLTHNRYTDEVAESPGHCKRNRSCIDQYHFRMKADQENDSPDEMRNRPPLETMAHFLEHNMEKLKSWDSEHENPCWVMNRVSIGSFEKTVDTTILDASELDDSKLYTRRFRFHDNLETSGINGKPIIDSSRYDGGVVGNPHRVRQNLCKRGPIVRNEESIFRIQHYTGSAEHYTSRGKPLDGFVQRQPGKIQGESLEATRWVPEFIRRVGGVANARALTHDLQAWAVKDYQKHYGKDFSFLVPDNFTLALPKK